MRFKLECISSAAYNVISTNYPMQIYGVRWLIMRDFLEVLDIEEESFDDPWAKEDFLYYLRRNCKMMVSESDNNVDGFMIYELHKGRLQIINFAVRLDYRRQGVGTAMMEVLKYKLFEEERKEIFTVLRESNLEAQLFFKSQGFWAERTLRDYYKDTGEDGYFMKYNVKTPNEFVPVNRITQYLERAA